MGVPKLFKTLTMRYPRILYNHNQHCFDALYFDLNCLIHPVCAKFASESQNIKFEKIKDYICLVVNYVNPKSDVFLYMDGVAPFAKVIQQRQRRFKSIFLKKKKQELSHNSHSDISWDSNAISPKTYFMNDLYIFLKQAFPDYHVSGTDLHGEGEHKIVDSVLKSNYRNICIYGLDADLIILSWVICILRPKISVSLVREYSSFGIKKSEHPFHFMDINKLMNHFYHDLNLNTNKESECTDFIFLSFFLGNDFLPNLFGVSLQSKGYDVLINTYVYCKRTFPQFQIVSLHNKRNPISWKCVHLFLSSIYRQQSHILEDFMTAYFKYHPREPEFESIIDKLMYQFEYISEKTDPVKVNTTGWEERFMSRYHSISDTPFDKLSAMSIVDNYLAGLLWNLKYYFKLEADNISYGFLYSHPMSPPLKYIVTRLELNSHFNFEQFWNIPAVQRPLHPFVALSLILPKESFHLFDHTKTTTHTPDNIDVSKIKFITDYKHFWGESFVVLPSVDFIFYSKS